MGDWLGRVPQELASPPCLNSIEWTAQVPHDPTEHAPMLGMPGWQCLPGM